MQKHTILGLQKKKNVLCAPFSGKGRKKGTHINFFGGILVPSKKGIRNGPFSATKSLVYCFFHARIQGTAPLELPLSAGLGPDVPVFIFFKSAGLGAQVLVLPI